MKFALFSDLHLEFWKNYNWQGFVDKINTLEVDLVVNAGDTHPFPEMRGYFSKLIKLPYMEILGNHDFYGHQNAQASYKIHIQDIKGLKVCGCTLWTDFDSHDPLSLFNFKTSLADGWQIEKVNFPTLADEIYDIHQVSLKQIEKEKPDIVVTHHAPSLQCVHPQFKGQAMNYYFVSNLDNFILNNQNIKIWGFGHTHRDMDVMVGGTRIVSRQLGYPNENYSNVNDFKPLIIEV